MPIDTLTNVKAMRKPELVTFTNVCLAEIEALRASLDARALSIINLQRDLDRALDALRSAQDRETTLRKNETIVRDRAALLIRCKQLAQQGVPCYVQGNFVFHRLTKAILAEAKA